MKESLQAFIDLSPVLAKSLFLRGFKLEMEILQQRLENFKQLSFGLVVYTGGRTVDEITRNEMQIKCLCTQEEALKKRVEVLKECIDQLQIC